jgi:parvulin-like peptidyl-prolyl isomerase
MMKKNLLLAGLAACLAFQSGAWGADTLFGKSVIARGKNVEVTQDQLDEAVISFKGTRAAAGQPVSPQNTQQITAQILDKLIATQIFLSRATPKDKTLGTAAAENFIKKTMADAPSPEAFKRRLLAQGTTLDEFQQQVTEQYIVKTVIDRELGDKIKVTETEIKSDYDANKAAFTDPEKVKVAHILLSIHDFSANRDLPPAEQKQKRETAEKVDALAKAGQDFTKLVREYSDDPESKAKNGEYTFARGGRIPKEFEAAAFSLKEGQVSDVVASPFGFHVIKLLERIPEKVTPLAQAHDQIHDRLFQQEAQKLVPDYVKKLREEYGVKVDWP